MRIYRMDRDFAVSRIAFSEAVTHLESPCRYQDVMVRRYAACDLLWSIVGVGSPAVGREGMQQPVAGRSLSDLAGLLSPETR